jgi:hypothetical protein
MSTSEHELKPDHETRLDAKHLDAAHLADPKQQKSTEPGTPTQAESFLTAGIRSLEMIAGRANLSNIVQNLCDGVDALDPEIISTILLMDPDGKRLWPAAGRRVPSGWRETITPLEIGPCMGSCGTAAFRKEPVICSDIAIDSLWAGTPAAEYRDIALSHGIRAAGSVLISILTAFCRFSSYFFLFATSLQSRLFSADQSVEGKNTCLKSGLRSLVWELR